MFQLCSLLLLLLLEFSFHATSTDDFSTYIVHLDPSSRPKHFTTNQQWHSSIVSAVKSSTSTTSDNHHHFSSLENSFLYSYQNALHGFSAVLSQQELQTVQNHPGFLSSYKDKLVTMDTTYTSQFMSLNHQPASGLPRTLART
ncbi:unnamed protein product [Linum tenue]|uniref:Inhibitor I9 domain-containing protein n=1 Tax=Linum tenue TaxID=586396 RepID=A0AAV0MZS1_9ROSI|nr:unnamed protein product [Linum tenue]